MLVLMWHIHVFYLNLMLYDLIWRNFFIFTLIFLMTKSSINAMVSFSYFPLLFKMRMMLLLLTTSKFSSATSSSLLYLWEAQHGLTEKSLMAELLHSSCFKAFLPSCPTLDGTTITDVRFLIGASHFDGKCAKTMIWRKKSQRKLCHNEIHGNIVIAADWRNFIMIKTFSRKNHACVSKCINKTDYPTFV